MSAPDPAPAVPPTGARPATATIVRAAAVTAIALAVGFFLLLALVATLPLVRETMKPLVSDYVVVSLVAALIVLALVLFLPLAILARLTRRGVLRWPQLTALGVVLAAGFAWLAWDDATVRRPLTMDELAPALPGDEASHALILRYGKDTPATNAYQPSRTFLVAQVGPKDPEKWAKHLRDHRAEIAEGWTNLSAVRAWWDELAAQPRLGDLTPARVDAPIIAFQPIRSYSQYAICVAGLLALDGRGDEAMDVVIKLYDVARKLEPNSRTLVRSMIAKVVQRMSIETATFIITRTAVSPAKKQALAESLAAAIGGPAGVRRLVLIEYAYFQPFLGVYLASANTSVIFGDKYVHRGLRYFSRVLVNPRATQNLVGDRYYQLASDAEDRRLADFQAHADAIGHERSRYHVKNLGGLIFADLAMPAFSKVVKVYWEIDDLRLDMIARLGS